MNTEELVEKITPMFLRSGYKSLKMDDIAEELSMSKKTIYNSFPSKIVLFHRVLENIYPYFEKYLTKYEKDSENVVAYFYKLKNAVEAMADIHMQRDFLLEIEQMDAKLAKQTYELIKASTLKFCEHTTIKAVEAGIQNEFCDAEDANFTFVHSYLDFKMLEFENEEHYQKLEKRWFYMHLRGTFNEKGCKMLDDYVRKHPELIG